MTKLQKEQRRKKLERERKARWRAKQTVNKPPKDDGDEEFHLPETPPAVIVPQAAIVKPPKPEPEPETEQTVEAPPAPPFVFSPWSLPALGSGRPFTYYSEETGHVNMAEEQAARAAEAARAGRDWRAAQPGDFARGDDFND